MPAIEQHPDIQKYPYKTLAKIEETNMSQVWLAETEHTEFQAAAKRVVLKIAYRGRTDTFAANQNAITNEEEWLRKLQGKTNRAGIVHLLPVVYMSDRPVYSAKTADPGSPWFIVLDYLPGGSLKEYLRQQRPTLRRGLHIARQLAQTLTYVHGQRCVHLDIKPDNVVFRQTIVEKMELPDIQPVLVDFGIARALGEESTIGGASAWLAPECYAALRSRQRVKIQPAMDIYPLGCLLHYMITGQHPGESKTLGAIPLPLLKNDRTVLPKHQNTLGERVSELIRGMTQPAPGQRPDAQRVADELGRLLALTADEPAPQRASGTLIGLALAAVALFVLVALATLTNSGSQLAASMGATTQAVFGGAQPPSATEPPLTLALTSPPALGAVLTAAVTATAPVTVTEPVTDPVTQDAGAADAPTATPAPPATTAPTETPNPIFVPTIATPGPTAMVTLAVRPTSTRAQTPTPTTSPAAAVQSSAASASNRSVQISEPLETELYGEWVTFAWNHDFALGSNERFEVAIWRADRDRITAIGLEQAGVNNTMTINLRSYSELYRERLQLDVRYFWAVRIVDVNGRFEWVSEPQAFTLHS